MTIYKNQKNNHDRNVDCNDNVEVNNVTNEFFICCYHDMVKLAHED